jgi:hypothetical protein
MIKTFLAYEMNGHEGQCPACKAAWLNYSGGGRVMDHEADCAFMAWRNAEADKAVYGALA